MSPSPAGTPGIGTGLPPPPGPLVGRAAELALLRPLLLDPEVRLVTLTGPPGVGKTRLALAAAATAGREFPDGVAFVDLTAVRNPELVAAEVAAALTPETGARAAGGLPPVLADQELLLVVDNFEHVLPAAAALRDLLAACPRLTALVTSRERLHLRTEREVPVSPLDLPGPADLADTGRLAATPAVALLLAHVRAFDPGFAITPANGAALAGICVRLDGLPLALELAAPRLRLFSPAELLARLRHRVGPLAADARDVPDRHRTLTSALTWSHDLLGDDERAMFRRLSVFVGGWTLEAAQRVCAVPDPLATTASLVDKSLIRRTGGSGDVARFGMLESLREFAAEQLDRAGERGATQDRHAAWFTEFAGHIERQVGTGDERAAIEWVGHDVGNLREALRHGLEHDRPASALPLGVALGWHAYTRGQLGEGEAVLRRVMSAADRSPEVPDEARADARLIMGTIALARGDLAAAEDHLTRGLRQGAATGSVRQRAIGTAFLGHLARTRGHVAEAVARHEEAGRLYEQSGNLAGVAWSRYDLGLLARRWRDPERAAGLLRQSLADFHDLGYVWATGCAAWALATVELRRGRTAEAAALLGEALDAFVATDDHRGVAQCLEASAEVAGAGDGPAAAAARLLGAAAALRDRLGAPLPPEDRGAADAVRQRVRHALDPAAAEDGERAGRALATAAALALARDVLARGMPARDVLAGGTAVRDDVPRPRVADVPEPLTPREAEVADLVRQGCTNRQIGRRLGISEKTTEVHVHNIIRKLGASSRSEIAAWVAGRARG